MLCHVFRAPWNNWHSSAAAIQTSSLAGDDALRQDPFFQNRKSADILQVCMQIDMWLSVMSALHQLLVGDRLTLVST
jgi:hypothetical protein